MSNSELVSALSELTLAAEQYYKWANKFDLRIEDHKLRSAISRAKSVLSSDTSSIRSN